MPITVVFDHNNKPLFFRLPKSYDYEVENVKSASTSSTSHRKTVELSCGAQITVPHTIKIGNKVKVDLTTYEYT